MEEQTVIIGPDGEIQISVRGLKGKACLASTEELEAALGQTTGRRATPEMAPNVNSNRIVRTGN